MNYLISALIGALFAICMVEGQRRPPNYSLDEMPRTSFSCRDKIVGGYYADPETDCQMFHVCVRVAGLGVQDFRFLCPNDTSFDQENQICDDWYNIDCEASTLFYSDNFDLYRISDGVPEFGPSRATPISLGPSSAPPIYSKPKQRPSHLPVNNAVSEDDDDTYLQKADTGDRRLHKDLLRGSSSGNFFANRNNGKEDNDDDDNTSSADFSKNKFGDAQAKKKTAKVAVRKLLTGKRPVNQATEQSTVASTTPVASTTVASVQQNNNFGGRQRYNTVQRARVTTPAPYVETSTAYNTNNNNFNNNNYNNNYNNNNYNSRNNNNNYNNYQTPTTAAPTSSVAYNNNFRSRGNVNFNTYQSNNNQENNNNYQETSSTTQATTVNNNNFNRNYNQNYNNNNNNNYNNYQYQTSTANPFNYNYQSTNNNYQSTNNNNGAQQQGSTKFYTQQQNVQQSSTTSNYYQTQQQSTNNNNNNNYYQQQQYNNNNNNFNNNYNAQSSSVASSAAYQQPTTYRTTSFNNNNNYQQNYNGNNNYNQQSTTFNYDKYYQTSTVAPRAFDKSTSYYTTTVAPQPSGFQNYYDKSSTSQAVNTNNYQAKNGNYNFNVKASVGGNNNYDPYNTYNGRGNEKYDEPTLGESLKTAPSSNIRPSDLNALAYNKEVKKNVGFNATVGTSYNFDKNSAPTKKVNPYTVAVPTVKAATNPPVTAAVVTSTARPSLIPQAPNQQYQNVQRQQNTQTQQYQNVQHQQNTPQQNTQTAQKLDNKSTAAPPAQSSPSSAAAKDNSYDYAYYDDASPSEYDGFEPAGEDFARTAARG